MEAEGRAQIRRAIDAGFDVSHLDMHMHALGLDARFFPVYLALAREFDVAADEPELHALLGDLPFRTGWRDRVDEYRIFTVDPELLRIVEATGTKLVRWKDVRTLQRRERAAAAARR